MKHILEKARPFIRALLYAPAMGTRYLNIRNFILARFCQWYYFRHASTRYDTPPVIADIGGTGKNQIKNLPGWGRVKVLTVNLYDDADIIDDAGKLEQIEDNSLDGIYSSHVVEHFWWWEAGDLFKLWHRKLKPHARIEIRCPDIEWIIKKCFKAFKKKKLSKVWEDILLHNVYGASVAPWHRYYEKEGQYHRNLFWKDRLKKELSRAGFSRIRRVYYFRHGFDFWPYDIRYKQYYGKILVRDLVMEGYKT